MNDLAAVLLGLSVGAGSIVLVNFVLIVKDAWRNRKNGR